MTTSAKPAAKATASTKAKDAEILELQKQLSDYRQTIEEMAAKFEKLEIKQRLWVKEQKDGSLFTAGTTKAGAKKVTIYAAKSTKDANGKYVAGAWKALVLTDTATAISQPRCNSLWKKANACSTSRCSRRPMPHRMAGTTPGTWSRA